MMDVQLAIAILARHGRTLSDLMIARPEAISLSEGTVDRDGLARFLNLLV